MKKNAFTLIELLIVVAIIGILAAIAVPNFVNAQTRARLAGTFASLKTAQTAMQSYMIDFQNAPIDMGPDAETGGTYIALTTPIAYLSSIDAFYDEFRTPSEEDAGVYYAYGAPYHVGRFDDTDRIALFKRAGVEYFLFGWGPDREPNWPWPQLADTLMRIHSEPHRLGANQDGGMFYSPSNGLYSNGDIVATNARLFQ